MLPRTHRLPLSRAAGRTERFDFSIEGEFLRIRFRKNTLGHLRCSVTVPKRAFTGAVQRNRVKRVLQARITGIESMPADEKKGYDVAVWMKKATREPFEDYKADLLRELEVLLSKIGTKKK
jgi:ribonuclease P protein component